MSVSALAALAVQYWKLCAAVERAIPLMGDDRAPAMEAQLRFARHKLNTILENEGLRLATYDGACWTSDIPARPVNVEDLGEVEAVIVESTLEPTILGPDGIIHPGQILLRKG